MKTSVNKLIFYVVCSFIFTSCWPDIGNSSGDPTIESIYEPILMTREEFEESVIIEDPRNMGEVGKIYLIESYIFINDNNKGFHLYDNQDPTNPSVIKYINIPGSTDIAIRNNIAYVNQATDLIALSFTSNYENIAVTERIRNVFPPEYLSPDGIYINYGINKILVGWRLK